MAFSEQTHTDAVMCLSLNPFQSEYLASGSADHTVRIWDLDEGICKMTYREVHTDKVQSVRWNRVNEQVLLTGGYDGIVNVMDVRSATGNLSTKLPKNLYKDIESAQWHPSSEHNFIVTTESGHLIGYDSRRIDNPVFNVQAHRKACSSATFSPHVPNMLVSVGTDKMCKIWDITANAAADGATYEPHLVQEKDMKQGDLFSVQMYADIPWVMAAGGQKGEVAIWDTEEDSKVRQHFKSQMPEKAKTLKSKADKGYSAADADMVEDAAGDSSGFEDVDSDDESETQEVSEPIVKKSKDKKASKSKK